MKIHRDNMKQPHFHKLFLDVSCVPTPFTIQIKVNRLKTDSTWSDQISSKRTSTNKESCHDKSSIHSYPQFKKHLSWDVMGTSMGVNCIRHSSRLLPSFLDGRMAWHFQIRCKFHKSQLWHWLPSKQKYVTDCCIAAIFRVAFLSFLLFSKDSLWLLPFSSSSLMTRREKAIENLWRTRMIRSQKALRCQSRRAHIEVKEGWENETQVMDMSYVPAVQRNECVLNQGPPPKTDHFNFGNWILRLQSIHAYEHANNTVLTNKQNPLKHLKTLLCEFLHTLKSKSPADTTSSPKRIPEPVSSMLPDRLSATKFDKCQVATTLSLVYCKIM